MGRLFYRLLKLYLLKVQTRRMSPLAAFPFTVFVELTLDTIYEEGGMVAVSEAVRGWWDNLSHQLLDHKGEMVKVMVGRDLAEAEIDAAYRTVAQLVHRFRAMIGKGSEPVIMVNGEFVTLGRWLRPGDEVHLGFIRKED